MVVKSKRTGGGGSMIPRITFSRMNTTHDQIASLSNTRARAEREREGEGGSEKAMNTHMSGWQLFVITYHPLNCRGLLPFRFLGKLCSFQPWGEIDVCQTDGGGDGGKER